MDYDKTTIQDKLNFMRICDEAVAYYSRMNEVLISRMKGIEDLEKVGKNRYENNVSAKKYIEIKNHIVLDLMMDPKFITYTSNLAQTFSDDTLTQKKKQNDVNHM